MSEEENYVILRDLAHIPERFEADLAVRLDSPLGRTKSLGRTINEIGVQALDIDYGQPKLTTEVASLSKREAQDALRDPRTVGIAPAMMTALIAPLASDDVDELGGTPWGICVTGALTSCLTGRGVKVAVLDTGIDSTHVAFRGVKINERDFSGDGSADVNGHGTHCAGTILGREVGGVRIGVAPGVEEAVIGKVLRNDGTGDTAMLFRALSWVIEQDVDVISMSLGFDFPGYVRRLNDAGWPVDLATSKALVTYRDNLRLFDNLMQRLRLLAPLGRGAVVVAASGNESRADKDHPDHRIAVTLPAAADGLVSVGALQQDEGGLSVAPFSNTMARVSAPGVAIKSAQRGTADGLISKSGTSMACPHAAGVAALWWESLVRQEGVATAIKVENKLLANVRTDVFSKGVLPLDRGDGMVAAPQN